MKKYKTGLIIGRFQPLHNGHVYLIKKALEICEKVIIGIGSSNMDNVDNPWRYDMRKMMIEELIKYESLQNKITKIFPSPDIADDTKWLEDVLGKVGKFDIVIGNNDWVNGIFASHGYKVLRVDYFRRDELEGQLIRKLMRENKKWEDRVPIYIAKLIKEV